MRFQTPRCSPGPDTQEVRLRSLLHWNGGEGWRKQWEIKALWSAQKVFLGRVLSYTLGVSRWQDVSVSCDPSSLGPRTRPHKRVAGPSGWRWSDPLVSPRANATSPDCVLTAATAPNSSSEPAAPCPRHYREMLFTGLLCSLCPIIVHPRQMAKCTGGFHPPGLSPSFAYSTVTKAWAAKGLTTHSTQERAQNEKGRE